MKLSAIADVGVIAIGTENSVSVMLDITAPELHQAQPRSAQSIQIVLDRSGSMAGERLDAAKQAIAALVRRLAPEDAFGLVVFDDSAQVVIPNGLMSEHNLAHTLAMISAINAGGSTDMSAGYTLALSEVKRNLPEGGGTVIMLSDGHANAGVQEPAAFAQLATQATTARVTTSAIGIGIGYNEFLLDAMASAGGGNHVFAEQDDAAIALLLEQVDGLLSKSAMNTHLRLKSLTGIDAATAVTVLQRLNNWVENGDVVIRLGDLISCESTRLILDIAVPARGDVGQLPLLDVVLEYLAVPSLEQHSVTTQLAVAVSADAVDVVVANPQVRIERLLAVVQNSKRSAVEAMMHYDDEAALRNLSAARESVEKSLAHVADSIDDATRQRALEEIVDLTQIEERIKRSERESSMKFAMENWSQKSRGRKRREFPLEDDDTFGA